MEAYKGFVIEIEKDGCMYGWWAERTSVNPEYSKQLECGEVFDTISEAVFNAKYMIDQEV